MRCMERYRTGNPVAACTYERPIKFPTMRTLIGLFLFCTAVPLEARSPTTILQELNALYNGSVRFKIDQEDRLVADLFDHTGHFRQDVVYIEFLDPNGFKFSEEESAVVMTCASDHANCIEKEVFRMNVIRHTGRSVFPAAAGDADGAKAIGLLAALVSEAQQEIARKAAETHARPQRKR